MKIRNTIAALVLAATVATGASACNGGTGCYDDDGEQVSCNQNFDDDDDDDDNDSDDDDNFGDDD